MAFLTMTYTFVNGTTASATEVNANFQKVVDANSDGTISYNIAALTAAGTTTLNGAVILGASSSVDMTFNAALATSIPIKTTNTYDIGSASKGLAGVYVSIGTTYTARIVGASGAAAAYTLTLPNSGGTKGYVMQTDGSGTLSYVPYMTAVNAVSSANYAFLTTDGYGAALFTTGNSPRTCTLPTAASSAGRSIKVSKVDSGTGKVTIDATWTLWEQYDSVEFFCDGTSWYPVQTYLRPQTSVKYYGGTRATGNTRCVSFGNAADFNVGTGLTIVANDGTNGASFTIVQPGVYTISSCMRMTVAGGSHGITKNSAALSTDSSGQASGVLMAYQEPSVGQEGTISVTLLLAVGDVIRPMVDGASTITNDPRTSFVMTQVSKHLL